MLLVSIHPLVECHIFDFLVYFYLKKRVENIAEEPPKQEKLIITTAVGTDGRTVVNFFFDKKLKRSIEMTLTDEFLQNLLSYVEKFIGTQLFVGDYEGICFEDFADRYKSFNMNLNPCDMSAYNGYYEKDRAEHVASVSLRWIKGPDAKRPSRTSASSTKKQLVGELYKFIREANPALKSELVESLLDADLYDYYDRIR